MISSFLRRVKAKDFDVLILRWVNKPITSSNSSRVRASFDGNAGRFNDHGAKEEEVFQSLFAKLRPMFGQDIFRRAEPAFDGSLRDGKHTYQQGKHAQPRSCGRHQQPV